MSPCLLPETGLERLLSFWTATFGVPEGTFAGVWAAVPPERRRTFVHTEAGEILSTVQVFVLPLNGADVGCVANVATAPSARGRGLSTALLEEAIRWMEGSGIALSYLFTGVPKHYARLGWASTTERIRRIESDAAAIAPGAPDIDLMALLYADSTPPFAMVRDTAWWERVVGPRLQERVVWTTANAYVVASPGDELAIEEAVGDPRESARLVHGATAWAGGRASLHGDLELGVADLRPGGMLRGGAFPPQAWFSSLDHF